MERFTFSSDNPTTPMNFLNLFNQGKTQSKSHIKNLIEMAVADGEFCQAEYDLLRNIAKKIISARVN